MCKKFTLESMSSYVENLIRKKKERKSWGRKARKKEGKGGRKCGKKSLS